MSRLDRYFGWSLCAEILTDRMLFDSAARSIWTWNVFYSSSPGSCCQEGMSISGLWLIRKVLSRRHAPIQREILIGRRPSQRFIGFLDNTVVVWVLCRIGCFLWGVERRKGRGEAREDFGPEMCRPTWAQDKEIHNGVHIGSSSAACLLMLALFTYSCIISYYIYGRISVYWLW